jgi:hypothetical protein
VGDTGLQPATSAFCKVGGTAKERQAGKGLTTTSEGVCPNACPSEAENRNVAGSPDWAFTIPECRLVSKHEATCSTPVDLLANASNVPKCCNPRSLFSDILESIVDITTMYGMGYAAIDPIQLAWMVK